MSNEKFKIALSRLSQVQWSFILGKNVYDTFNACKPNLCSEELIEIALNLYDENEIVDDDEKIKIILTSIDGETATELCKRIGIKENKMKDPHFCLLSNLCKKTKKVIKNYYDISSIEKINIEPLKYEIDCKPDLIIRDYQRAVISKSLRLLDKDGRCLIHMPTGSGKTTTAMDIVCRYMRDHDNTYVIWLAYSQELCQQADNTFRVAWKARGDRTITVYDLFGPNKDLLPNEHGDYFVICTLAKLGSIDKKNPNYLSIIAKKVSVVVFDEAHQSVAPEYRALIDQIIETNVCCKLIGLTATPARSWLDSVENKKLPELYYNNKVSIDVVDKKTPMEMLTSEGYLSKIEWLPLKGMDDDIELLPSEIEELKKIRGTEKNIPYSVIEKLSGSIKRNLRILGCLNEMINNRGVKRVLVFANSIEHGKTLSSIFKTCGYKSSFVDGTTQLDLRRAIIENFKNDSDEPMVLCNYNLLSTGVDIPNIDAGIIARPMASVVLFSQMVGRMIRGPKNENGTSNALVATIVDNNLPDYDKLYDFWMKEWGN